MAASLMDFLKYYFRLAKNPMTRNLLFQNNPDKKHILHVNSRENANSPLKFAIS